MKKLTLLISVFITLSSPLLAQVPNAGFEYLNSDGTVSNWGNVYLFAVTIDSDGHSSGDSIVMANYFYSSTTDAHSGSRALALGNALNYSSGECIIGSAGADVDTVFSSWSSLELIPTTVAPSDLSFYYKFFPLNSDSGVARLVVYDSFTLEIGSAEIIMSGTHAAYTYATTPVITTAPGNAAFFSINFSTSTGKHPATYGTRLLIDDVNTNTTGVSNIAKSGIALSCYPTLVTDHVHLLLTGITHTTPATIIITDMQGRELMQTTAMAQAGQPLMVNVSNYPAGVYIATLATADGRYTARFVK